MQSTERTINDGRSIFKEIIGGTQSEQDRRLRLKLETGLFLLLTGIIFFVRITAVTTYNTLFVDEAIYATVGEEVLSGVFVQGAISWMFGSYLYPAVAAITSHFGGVVGLRLLSATLSTITAIFVYLTTLRLFNRHSALWAMLVFGLTGVSISLGQIAVYDTLGVTFLAMTLYLLTMTALKTNVTKGPYLFLAAVSFSLSVLSKYIALFYLPALILIALTLYASQQHPIRPLFTKFLGSTSLILGAYVLYYLYDLINMLGSSRTYSFQSSVRWLIAKAIWDEIGVVILIALVGIFLLSRTSLANPSLRIGWLIFLAAILIPFLTLLLLAAPVYHVAVEPYALYGSILFIV